MPCSAGRRFHFIRHLPAGLASLALYGCSPLDIPTGPNLDAIEEVYEAPDGYLESDGMEVVTEVVEKATEALARLGNLDFVVQTLGNVGDTIRNAASSDDGGILKVTGVSDVVGICPGLESKATTDEANGKLTFTVTFDKSFVDPVIWGEFMDCQFNQSGLGITLNSTMDLHLGAPMALDSLRFDEILFRLDGSYVFEGTSYPLGLDFRLQEDAIEFRIPAEGGDVIAKLGRDLSEVAIRTSDGSFCCHFENRYCDEVTGDSCEDPADGTRLSW